MPFQRGAPGAERSSAGDDPADVASASGDNAPVAPSSLTSFSLVTVAELKIQRASAAPVGSFAVVRSATFPSKAVAPER
jgi:hypothetical protein